MLKRTFLGLGLLGVLVSGSALISDETIQLKEPAPLTEVADDADAAAAQPDPAAGNLNANTQSYSMVIENSVGPDGKRIQKRKVWQNGTLVEEKEEVVEGDDEDVSAEMNGETIPGMISRSEQNGEFFGLPEEMSEMLNEMHENLGSLGPGFGSFGSGPAAMPGLDPETRQRIEEQMRQAESRIQGALPNIEEARARMDAARAEMYRRFGGAAPAALSEYWIGASVSPVSDETAYQLGLGEGEGLLVREIVPGSPAEKAGLAKYDIILQVGGTAVSTAEEIGGIVDGADGNPLEIQYIRKGERASLELTPEKRPETPLAQAPADESGQTAPREQIRVVRPGMIVPQTGSPEPVPEAAGDGAPQEAPAVPQQGNSSLITTPPAPEEAE